MATKPLPSPEVLRQLLRYEPETGRLFWRSRPADMFHNGAHTAAHVAARWNARYAGKEAFTSISVYGYLRGAVFDQVLLAHRVIWCIQTGEWPAEDIDHINRDRACNKWVNLRAATRSENHRNRASRAGSTSRFLGVSWAADRSKWTARISTTSGYQHLGAFTREQDAAMEYDRAAKIHHGEFARLNFPALTGA